MSSSLATVDRRALYGYALRLTHDCSRADDLVQDTMLRALRYSHAFRPEANVDKWLRQTLRNVFIDSWHRDRRTAALHSALQVSPAPSPALDIDPTQIAAAIAQLPDEQRTAIILCEIDGYSYAEIAEQTATPIGTVMSRLRRGRTRLHVLLREHAVELGLVAAEVVSARPRFRH